MAIDNSGSGTSPRRIHARLGADGKLTCTTHLTHASRTDTVKIILDTVRVLPIVFVPGIMGSNLKVLANGRQAWRLDSELGVAGQQVFKDAAERRAILHPARTEVDPDGAVPKFSVGSLEKPEHFRQRGWGEIAAVSYQDTLVWLEKTFHCMRGTGVGQDAHAAVNQKLRERVTGKQWGMYDSHKTPFKPLTEQDCLTAESWTYPVYAFGYNWLDSNENSAARLALRIEEIIAANNGENGNCEQVILVTHSMGGLTARRCAQLPGMADRIAGIVHGVMPAIGAAVAYRRCKVGMWDENLLASLVIGRTGKEVTAVFSQAPGALELLPTKEYTPRWLEVRGIDGAPDMKPPDDRDPYSAIYLQRGRWWGLIHEPWLQAGAADLTKSPWGDYVKTLAKAAEFHGKIARSYHPNSWVFYGIGLPTFDHLVWVYKAGPDDGFPLTQGPSSAALLELTDAEVHPSGDNPQLLSSKAIAKLGPYPSYLVGGALNPRLQLLQAQNPLDGPINGNQTGDGTVPVSSGIAPGPYVKQFFPITGVEHEPAYKSQQAKDVTAYAIAKIAVTAATCFAAPAAKAST